MPARRRGWSIPLGELRTEVGGQRSEDRGRRTGMKFEIRNLGEKRDADFRPLVYSAAAARMSSTAASESFAA